MNNKLKTKGCKRCGGDLAKEQDTYGTFLSCIQCGAEYPFLPQETSATGSIQVEKKEAAMSGYAIGAARR